MHKPLSNISFNVIGVVMLLITVAGNAQDSTVFVVSPPDTLSFHKDTDENFDRAKGSRPITERKLSDSTVNRFKKDDDFWYANTIPVKEKRVEPFWNIQWVKTLIWILIIGCFIAIVILFLAASNISLFKKKGKAIQQGETGIQVTENIFE